MYCELAGLQVERPDVVDVAVARDLRVDRLRRIGGRRREHQRVGVEELRRRVVVGAEGQLGLLPGLEVQPKQLLVAADPGDVDDRAPSGDQVGPESPNESLVTLVICLGVEVQDEDVADAALERRKPIFRPSGEKSGDSDRPASSTGYAGRSVRCDVLHDSVRHFSLRTNRQGGRRDHESTARCSIASPASR